jgi:hypothetical protein
MLMAQPFDAEHLKLIGEALPLNAEIDSDAVSRGFSVSENGVLAHTSVRSGTASPLVWLDREGKRVGTFGPTGFYGHFRLSPDEKQIAFSNRTRDLYVLDSTAGIPRRLTFPEKPEIDDPPLWSPDGRQVVWASNRAGAFDLYMKAANGASPEKHLVKMGTPTGWPEDWSRDGRYLIYEIPGDKSGEDLWVAPQQPPANGGDQKPFPYLNTAADERHGRLSPDGRWMAYSSNETGRDEVYVQSFPTLGVKYQVSSQGGVEPQWRRDGGELFYIEGRTLMAVTIKLPAPSNDALQIGGPKPLFRLPFVETFVGRSYDVSNDGQRFLTAASADGPAPPITVVLNWHLQLKR